MSQRFLVYAHMAERRMTDATGSPVVLPPLVEGDAVTLAVRLLDLDAAGSLVEVRRNVRSMKASIGPVAGSAAVPAGGAFTLKIGEGGAESDSLWPGSSAAEVKAAIEGLAALSGYGGSPVVVGLAARGIWLVKFDHAGAVPLQVHTNRLDPVSFVRVRAYEHAGVWWHELRLVMAPIAFTDAFESVLADAPSISTVRDGSTEVVGLEVRYINEIQALYVPPEYRGTYALSYEGRETEFLGVDAGIEEIAAALNDLYDDGKTRFLVTVPKANTAYIEFTGDLKGTDLDEIQVVPGPVEGGDMTFSLNLATAECQAALRAGDFLGLLELELEIGEDGEEELPGKIVTAFREPVTVVREANYDELATRQQIDWLRPPQPTDYVPFTPDQIITGSQHWVGTIGDGAATTIVVAHNLGTRDLHLTLRENDGTGLVVEPVAYDVEIDSDDAITLKFAVAPALNGIRATISTAGPVSAFQAHTHTMGQIDGLEELLTELTGRVAVLEEVLPAAQPGYVSPDAGEIKFDIPDLVEIFPGRFAPDAKLEEDLAKIVVAELPRPGGLLPAIHDASVANLSTILTGGVIAAASGHTGAVFVNDTGATFVVPGGMGRRSLKIRSNEHLGSDGRVWYAVDRQGATTSYHPRDFERELFLVAVNENMLRVGRALHLELEIAARLITPDAFRLTRAQWVVELQVGTVPQQTGGGEGENLSDIAWESTASLSQRIVLTNAVSHHKLGLTIRRSAGGIECDRMLYGAWTGGAHAPASANFALRGRLLRFDTENSQPDPRGFVAVKMEKQKATIS